MRSVSPRGNEAGGGEDVTRNAATTGNRNVSYSRRVVETERTEWHVARNLIKGRTPPEIGRAGKIATRIPPLPPRKARSTEPVGTDRTAYRKFARVPFPGLKRRSPILPRLDRNRRSPLERSRNACYPLVPRHFSPKRVKTQQHSRPSNIRLIIQITLLNLSTYSQLHTVRSSTKNDRLERNTERITRCYQTTDCF